MAIDPSAIRRPSTGKARAEHRRRRHRDRPRHGPDDEAGDENYPFYWTSTTHINLSEVPGSYGAYVAFGEALGYFGPPGMEAWVDVHGAGGRAAASIRRPDIPNVRSG